LAKYYVQTRQPAEALRILGNLQETDTMAQRLAGAAFLQEDNLDQALRILEAALKTDRTLIDARLNLAEVYGRTGDHARAARYLATARGQMAAMGTNVL
jgi:Tfp pilus assembly protein PilF